MDNISNTPPKPVEPQNKSPNDNQRASEFGTRSLQKVETTNNLANQSSLDDQGLQTQDSKTTPPSTPIKERTIDQLTDDQKHPSRFRKFLSKITPSFIEKRISRRSKKPDHVETNTTYLKSSNEIKKFEKDLNNAIETKENLENIIKFLKNPKSFRNPKKSVTLTWGDKTVKIDAAPPHERARQMHEASLFIEKSSITLGEVKNLLMIAKSDVSGLLKEIKKFEKSENVEYKTRRNTLSASEKAAKRQLENHHKTIKNDIKAKNKQIVNNQKKQIGELEGQLSNLKSQLNELNNSYKPSLDSQKKEIRRLSSAKYSKNKRTLHKNDGTISPQDTLLNTTNAAYTKTNSDFQKQRHKLIEEIKSCQEQIYQARKSRTKVQKNTLTTESQQNKEQALIEELKQLQADSNKLSSEHRINSAILDESNTKKK